LTYGEGFQRDYQDFEAARIATGASIADEHFFDQFPRHREVISSRSGPEEEFARVPRPRIDRYASESRKAWGLFGAGLTAIATAFLLRLRSGPRRLMDSDSGSS
jgi:hypothetical protein